MEEIRVDVLIIGGGGAGLSAAIAVAEHAPALKIGVISKVYPVRSHTVSAEGGIAGVIKKDDSLESHAFDTIRGSDYLADQDAVEFFVREAPKRIIELEHWGCPWSRNEDGTIATRAFGGMSVKRTVYAADKTGFYMLSALWERCLKHESIRFFDEWYVTDLFADNGEVQGAFALDMKRGVFGSFSSPSVIIATGGACRIFAFNTNGAIKTGDGMALAYRIGSRLKDMEFVQFHPTGLPRTGILITEGARGEGGYLLNNKGERFMQRYLPTKMELGPRDIISRAIVSEIKAGRAFQGPYGPYVHLDIRHLGEQKIEERLPLVREIALEFAGIDPVDEPIPVTPVAHYYMGGIHTDRSTATDIQGLFAAGETACVSINGANRLGSNSLAECLVFGHEAGVQAAQHTKKSPPISAAAAQEAEQKILKIFQRTGHERVADLRETLTATMQQHVGIERDEKNLSHALTAILDLKERARRITLRDTGLQFNTDLTGLLELENMLLVAEACVRSALERRESRGSHLRTDYPDRNDAEFLKHLLVGQKNNDVASGHLNFLASASLRPHDMIFSDLPVTITQWQPKKREY